MDGTTDMRPCPYLVVLEGRECGCAYLGQHTVHRYRSPSGKRYEFELASIEELEQ